MICNCSDISSWVSFRFLRSAFACTEKYCRSDSFYTRSFVKTSVYLTDTEILCQVKVGFHEVYFLFFGFHTEFTDQTLGA